VSALVTLETVDGVAYVTLNRPDKLNAITVALRDDFLAVLDTVRTDPGIRCVVLRAEGKAFCTGQDLGERAPIVEGTPIDLGAALEDGINRIVLALTDLPQPTIAAVQGVAVGAGASLAIACDIVLAAEPASFHFSFSRLGLVPDSGASWLLPRKIGQARAASVLLTATPISAAEATNWGLVSQLAPDADALDTLARDMAVQLASRSPEALRATKTLLASSFKTDLATQLELEADAQTQAGHSDAYKAALTRFLKR
jgi:2-(1,2-epoxy-1,2-dihydrophenyl)acetyl-CoA isomerase